MKKGILFCLMILLSSIIYGENKIYKGGFASSNNIISVIEDNKIYSGSAVTSNKILGVISNGKVYEGCRRNIGK